MARAGVAGAQAGRGPGLALGRRVGVLRADLEQADVVEAAIGVARGRRHQPRQHRGAHHVEVAADRVDQAYARGAAAEQLGLAAGDEGEGHRLLEAAPGERRTRQ